MQPSMRTRAMVRWSGSSVECCHTALLPQHSLSQCLVLTEQSEGGYFEGEPWGHQAALTDRGLHSTSPGKVFKIQKVQKDELCVRKVKVHKYHSIFLYPKVNARMSSVYSMSIFIC